MKSGSSPLFTTIWCRGQDHEQRRGGRKFEQGQTNLSKRGHLRSMWGYLRGYLTQEL